MGVGPWCRRTCLCGVRWIRCCSSVRDTSSARVPLTPLSLTRTCFSRYRYEIYQSEQVDKSYIDALCSNATFVDYIDTVLMDFRRSLSNSHIYQFFCNFFPKVSER